LAQPSAGARSPGGIVASRSRPRRFAASLPDPARRSSARHERPHSSAQMKYSMRVKCPTRIRLAARPVARPSRRHPHGAVWGSPCAAHPARLRKSLPSRGKTWEQQAQLPKPMPSWERLRAQRRVPARRWVRLRQWVARSEWVPAPTRKSAASSAQVPDHEQAPISEPTSNLARGSAQATGSPRTAGPRPPAESSSAAEPTVALRLAAWLRPAVALRLRPAVALRLAAGLAVGLGQRGAGPRPPGRGAGPARWPAAPAAGRWSWSSPSTGVLRPARQRLARSRRRAISALWPSTPPGVSTTAGAPEARIAATTNSGSILPLPRLSCLSWPESKPPLESFA
jgi:hypothetical protein